MRWLIAGAAILYAATPTAAQPVGEPLPRVVADLQGVWGGIASAPGWVPEVPVNTPVPNRAFGLALGGHVLPLRLGIVTFGAGVSIITARSKGDPSEVVTATTVGSTAPIEELPIVTTRMTSLVPQLSLNFGHRFGWSYLSAGYGPTKVHSTASATTLLLAASAPDRWNAALNFGGGARWFMKRHLAASFDLRFIKLSSRAATPTAVFAKRTQVVNLLVGISVQ